MNERGILANIKLWKRINENMLIWFHFKNQLYFLFNPLNKTTDEEQARVHYNPKPIMYERLFFKSYHSLN